MLVCRPAAEEVAKTRDKLVYISLGTVVNGSSGFYKKCISAFAGTPYQVIMSVGNQARIEDLGVIPENISVRGFVDQIAVLNKADVFLSHCGMNSASESLYCQVPLVMYPQTTEEEGVAARVEQLGAGIRLKKLTPSAICGAVEEVMDTPSYGERAREISDGFKRCPGAKGAADKIEMLAVHFVA